MGTSNQRGQVIIEMIVTVFLFAAMFMAVNHMSTEQRRISDNQKISKSVEGKKHEFKK